MTFSFEEHLIDIVAGINDVPVPPTPEKAGNGSHLIAKYNELVSSLHTVFKELTTAKSTQCILSSTGWHHTTAGERLVVVDDGVNETGLYLPTAPEPGTEIFLMHVPQGKSVTIMANDNAAFLYKATMTPELRFISVFKFASLIYIGQPIGIEINFGWVPSDDAAFVVP